MPNRRLSQDELERLLYPLLDRTRRELQALTGNDSELHWALRRKLYKELAYDERGKPMHRKSLKTRKRKAQNNQCALCHEELAPRGPVLDRIEAMLGYTDANTRLLCQRCDTGVQTERGYA